jgi:enoyl-CoA hydratase
MPGAITYRHDSDAAGAATIGRLQLAHPAKRNAIDIAMWRELRAVFDRLQALPPTIAPRVVVVSGADRQFASGGDIDEFAGFRFDRARLADFHERTVWPALQAMLDCDIPLLAQIDGDCLGGGLEIAACCDIRIGAASSRYGAPIARLGFPMAPSELALLARVAGDSLLREMLLEARLVDAPRALRLGLLHAVVGDDEVSTTAEARASAVAALAPQAARINKQSLRQLSHDRPATAAREGFYAYAPSAEHVEGVTAFVQNRPPRFGRG